jgi:hypothetical protein
LTHLSAISLRGAVHAARAFKTQLIYRRSSMRRLLACLAAIVLSACTAPGSTAHQNPPAASPRQPVAEGGMCGGFAGFQCETGLTCHMEAGSCKRIADAAGVCRKKPQACPMIYQPVCGCDGKTHGNACQASGAGVSVAAQGECKAS